MDSDVAYQFHPAVAYKVQQEHFAFVPCISEWSHVETAFPRLPACMRCRSMHSCVGECQDVALAPAASLTILLLPCRFKLVKFLSYVPRFALVTGTLRRSAMGVSGFSVVFLTVFCAFLDLASLSGFAVQTLHPSLIGLCRDNATDGFSASFMLTFGGRVSGYRNMTQSGMSLIRSLLGDCTLVCTVHMMRVHTLT